jgi:hypothetical protein
MGVVKPEPGTAPFSLSMLVPDIEWAEWHCAGKADFANHLATGP